LKKAIISLTQEVQRQYECSIQIAYQVGADRQFAHELYQLLHKQFEKISLIDELITLDNAPSFYSQAQMLFSNRLHALLLAYKYGAVPFAFIDKTNQQKIVGIFEDTDLEGLLISLDDVNISSFSIPYNSLLIEKISSVENKNNIIINNIISNIF
jgi:polysaccharide pyruvyl transferase WcaK-like protein